MRGHAELPDEVVDLARHAERVAVLTGAGMSAESGVPTFREAQTGLWTRFDPEELATRAAFRAEPPMVWGWYLWRVGLEARARPNAGHHAIAEWGQRTRVDVVTQNVDSLHERAGSPGVVHLHGSLTQFRCIDCGEPYDEEVVPPTEPGPVLPPTCAACGGWIRPGVVWFGEPLPTGAFDAALAACSAADLVLVVGTSGLVHPAAMLPELAARRGIPTVEVNPVGTALSSVVTHVVRGTAATVLPALVEAADQ